MKKIISSFLLAIMILVGGSVGRVAAQALPVRLNQLPAGKVVAIGSRKFVKVTGVGAETDLNYVWQATDEVRRYWACSTGSAANSSTNLNYLQYFNTVSGGYAGLGYYLNHDYLISLDHTDWLVEYCWPMGYENNENGANTKAYVSMPSVCDWTVNCSTPIGQPANTAYANVYKAVVGSSYTNLIWTRTATSARNDQAFYISTSGTINDYYLCYSSGANSNNAVRPALYLKADMMAISGAGTLANPYELERVVDGGMSISGSSVQSVQSTSQTNSPWYQSILNIFNGN